MHGRIWKKILGGEPNTVSIKMLSLIFYLNITAKDFISDFSKMYQDNQLIPGWAKVTLWGCHPHLPP